MIQLIIIIVSLVLLVLILHPMLAKAYTQFISDQYQKMGGEAIEKKDKILPKMEEKPSIIGESKFKLSQSKPNTATDLESEKAIEKESIFAPSTDSDPEITDVDDVPLEKVENLSEEEFDDEAETEEMEGLGPDAILASGVVFEDLIKTHQVIESSTASEQEEKDAGKIIYQNQKTDMFEQLASSGDSRIGMRISNLLDIHIQEMVKEQQAENQTVQKRSKQLDSQGFKDFDVNSIF